MITFNRKFPYGSGQSERAIEIPWALSKYNGGRRVLEVGCSFASENPQYIDALRAFNIPELHGIDVSSVEAPDFIKKTADIRESGYETGFFDFILCISTLEHVGKDNARFYNPIAELPPDRQSVWPVRRLRLVCSLRRAGHLHLLQSIPPAAINAEYFGYTE